MRRIGLLVTDLDGTLMGPKDEHHLYETFRARLNHLANLEKTVWAVSTGRSLSSFRHMFVPFQCSGITPDFVIIKHAFIYGVRDGIYLPHWGWNLHVMRMMLASRARTRKMLHDCFRTARQRFRRMRVTKSTLDRLALHFRDSATAESAADLLRSIAGAHKGLQVFEYLLDVEMRAIPHTKGLAALELARRLRVSPEDTLAIGDGLNDVSMMDGMVAGMSGCPANAKPEVMLAVHGHGGHISRQPALAGTLDVIDAHVSGTVRSALPADWDELVARNHYGIAGSDTGGAALHMISPREVWVFAAALVAVLVALAEFGLLGRFSSYIRWPIHKLIAILISRSS